MKYEIKKDIKDSHKCVEVCPLLNDVMIGSGFCQKECKHHKNNNMIENHGKNYDISLGGIVWLECDKLEISNKMEKIVKREEITHETYREILDIETHHNHEIIEDENGTIRWKENPHVTHFLKNISLNDLCPLLKCLGYGKNSEVYRKLYRDMGYSLYGYWEIFFWETNNEDASEYTPNKL